MATLSDSTFEGGPAVMTFDGDGTGELEVALDLTALLVVAPDSTLTQRVTVLRAGSYPFRWAADSGGAARFDRTDGWPFAGGTLSDSVYANDVRQCYDAECADRVVLRARWARQ